MARKKFVIIAISGNEEKWVEQWSKNILEANPDKIIINLTQYDDNSEVLFRKFIPENKLVLMKHPWERNFSKARNFTLEAVPEDTDWVMFVDLDEIITKESYKELEFVLNSNHPHEEVMVNIYNSVSQDSLVASLFYPRLFPFRSIDGKKLNPTFIGSVHNQLIYPNDEMTSARRSNISLYHYGYALSKEEMQIKHKRTEDLLREQIAKDPNDYFAYLNLAQLLRAKDDNKGTIEAAQKVLDLVESRINIGDDRFTNAFIMANEQLSTAYINSRQPLKAAEYANAVLKIKPDHLDSIMNLGEVYLMTNDLDQAEFWLKRYLFVQSRYDEKKDNSNIILNNLNSSFIVLYRLGIISAARGDWEQAEKHFWKSYETDPEYQDTFIRFIDCLKRQNKTKELLNYVNEFMFKHAEKAYQVYIYFASIELEDMNIEGAKFNYYQALNMLPKTSPAYAMVRNRWENMKAIFGDVAMKLFDTQNKQETLLGDK
jgi:tetratricopeptide (TPR) repeat protein